MSSNRPTLTEAVEEFYQTDRLRKRSPRTLLSYRRTLDALVRVCGGGSFPVRDLGPQQFSAVLGLLAKPASPEEQREVRGRKFGSGVTRTGRSEQSLNIDRSNLRVFRLFLLGREYNTRNLVMDFEREQVVDRDTTFKEPLTFELAGELLNAASSRHPRDRAAVAIGLLAGLRDSELRALRWRHVKLEGHDGPILDYPRSKQRGGHHRVVISPPLLAELGRWIGWYSHHHGELQDDWFVLPAREHGAGTKGGMPSVPMHPEWPIVPTRKAHALLPSIKPLLEAIGVQNLHHKGMHTLRRTFCDLMDVASGGDLRVVQELVGHKRIETTEGYTNKKRARAKADAVLRGLQDPFNQGLAPENVVYLANRHGGLAG